MLTTIIYKLAERGFKHHDKQSNKYKGNDKEYAYHVCMAEVHVNVMTCTMQVSKLYERYMK